LPRASNLSKEAKRLAEAGDYQACIRTLADCTKLLANRVRELEFDPIPDDIQERSALLQQQIDSAQTTIENLLLPTPGDRVWVQNVPMDQPGTVTYLVDENTVRVQFWRDDSPKLWEGHIRALNLVSVESLPAHRPLDTTVRYRVAQILENAGRIASGGPFTLTASDCIMMTRMLAPGMRTCLESPTHDLYVFPHELG
jgi:hypothetical protein